jgi:capsular polysaccharide export protein
MPQYHRAPVRPPSPAAESDLAQDARAAGRLRLCGAGPPPAVLAALFPDHAIERGALPRNAASLTGLAAWSGARSSGGVRARAAMLSLPFLELGEGLLRAPPWNGRPAPIVSATALALSGPPSPLDRLSAKQLLDDPERHNPELVERAAAARRDVVAARLGGEWWHGGVEVPELRGRDGLVVIDAAGGSPAPAVLDRMLKAALTENPPDKVALLAPFGTFPASAARGCIIVARPIDPWEALDRAQTVYAAGGEIGFLALLAGRALRCFGDTFYSGRGITTDDEAVVQQPRKCGLDEVFAALLAATRYADPYRFRPSDFEETLSVLAEWRRVAMSNRRISVCVGMSFWKRRRVGDFLTSVDGRPRFRRTAAGAIAAARARPGAIAVWASRMPAGLAEAAAREKLPLIRVEDGFIRSVGLGSDFMPAASLVFDGRGMYFDPSAESDLEMLLRETEFDAGLVERGHRLIAQLVARGITKYNLGTAAISLPASPGRRRILVPGQVEDDLSVRLGGGEIRSNLDLLTRVRAANPQAFIFYKPHPDVEAGHRIGAVADTVVRQFADAVVREVSTAALLTEIDELHTLTSLAGFEALLRGRKVVVYGRPFYAGWGLTTDVAGIDRGRRLSLEQLVAGVLLLYPRYVDPLTRLPCGPEVVIERLDTPELWRPGPLVVARRLQGALVRRWSGATGRAPTLADMTR